jgi:hypothetical protein
MLLDMPHDQRMHVRGRARPFEDAMRAVRIIHERKRLAQRNKFVHQQRRAAAVDPMAALRES